MSLLLHTCCAPCAIMSRQVLKEDGYETILYFNNPNIHPYREFVRRKEALRGYARQEGFPLILKESYQMERFLRQVVNREKERCSLCYALRLEETARRAREEGLVFFSTTLLISPYQDHTMLRATGEEVARKHNLSFVYTDLRPYFRESQRLAREKYIYRQGYCGCIYSEKERYEEKGESLRAT